MSPTEMAEVERVRDSVTRGLVSVGRLDVAAKLGSEVAKAAGGEATPPLNFLTNKQHQRTCMAALSPRVQRSLACRWAESVLDVFEREAPGNTEVRAALVMAHDFYSSPTATGTEEMARAYRQSVESIPMFRGGAHQPCPLSEPARYAGLALRRAAEPEESLRAKLLPDDPPHHREFMIPMAMLAVGRAVAMCRAEAAAVKVAGMPPEGFIPGVTLVVDGHVFDPHATSPWRLTWDDVYFETLRQHAADVIRELLTDRGGATA